MLYSVVVIASLLSQALAVHLPRQVKYVYLERVINDKTIRNIFDDSIIPAEMYFSFYSTNSSGFSFQSLVAHNIAFSTDGGGTFTYAGTVIDGEIKPPEFSDPGEAPTFNDGGFTINRSSMTSVALTDSEAIHVSNSDVSTHTSPGQVMY